MVQLYGLKMRSLEAPALTRRFFVYRRSARAPSPATESFTAFCTNLLPQISGRFDSNSSSILQFITIWKG